MTPRATWETCPLCDGAGVTPLGFRCTCNGAGGYWRAVTPAAVLRAHGIEPRGEAGGEWGSRGGEAGERARGRGSASNGAVKCAVCAETKPIEEFKRDGRRRDGHAPWCAVCQTGIHHANFRHGHTINGASPEYKSWAAMCERCRRPGAINYRYYGGKGIQVCPEWRGPGGFERFLRDMGPKPTPEHSIERLDSSRGYEPSNCVWATWTEQRRNRSDIVLLTLGGKQQTLREWAAETGIPFGTIKGRLQRGWSVERTLTTPVRFTPRWHDAPRRPTDGH